MTTPRDDIERLLFTYAERIDAGDFDGVADLFADAVITSEGSDRRIIGRDGALAMYEGSTRRYPNGTPLTKHVTTNVMIEVDHDGATATSYAYFTVLQAVPGELALQPIIAGRYHDRFDCVDRAWRFTGRHMIVDLVGELGHHLLFDLGPA
jgi:3-phenylpropionate/cinnamic acid dioxygenase small subunit